MNSFYCKNLLVTGGAGFIGSNFINHMLNKYNHINILNLDKLTYAGNLANTHNFKNNNRYSFEKGDICDEDLLNIIFKKYNIDGVINFAAESHVDNSILRPDIFLETNVKGTLCLLKTAYKFWMIGPNEVNKKFHYSRFHQVSTDEVFGSIDLGSFKECDSYKPSSPYSASKAAADMMVNSFYKTYGLNTTISISSNNFGPGQHKEKFIPKSIHSILNGQDVYVYGDGKNVRDWIYVTENCEAIEQIFINSNQGEVYNIGSKNELTNLQLLKKISDMIERKLNIKTNIVFTDDRPGHDKRYSLEIKKIKDDLGWIPKNKFDFFLDCYIDNEIKKHNNE